MRSFLKWAGGKYRIIDTIRQHLPEGNRLVEPFVGGGSVFLNTDYPSYTVSDTNKDLINLFTSLKEDKEMFVEFSKNHFSHNDEEYYYQLREMLNKMDYSMARASIFLYLNRHGYNGLCRYNSKGEFNVPFGRYKKVYFPEKEMLYFIEKSKNVDFICQDFRKTMDMAMPGDVIYCDPPYSPLSNTSNFTEYTKDKFTKEDHKDLVCRAEKLKSRGITIIISNHRTEETLELYKDAEIVTLDVQRSISSDGGGRRKVRELLAIYR